MPRAVKVYSVAALFACIIGLALSTWLFSRDQFSSGDQVAAVTCAGLSSVFVTPWFENRKNRLTLLPAGCLAIAAVYFVFHGGSSIVVGLVVAALIGVSVTAFVIAGKADS